MTTPNKQADPMLGVLPAVVLFITIGILMVALLADTPTAEQTAEGQAVAATTEEPAVVATEEVTEEATEEIAEEPAADFIQFNAAQVALGEQHYQTSCSACHGFDGTGIAGLGKNLIESEFIDGLDEAGFVQFVNVGRGVDDPLNTTGVAMPAKGGNPMLTDADIAAIYAYLRSQTAEARGEIVVYTEGEIPTAESGGHTMDDMGDMSGMETPASTEEAATDAGPAPELQPFVAIVPDGSAPASFDAKEVYALSCAGCHGLVGEGVEGYGSALSADLDADTLYDFLTTAGPVSDLDATQFNHPVGAAPYELSEEQLRELIDYILSLDN